MCGSDVVWCDYDVILRARWDLWRLVLLNSCAPKWLDYGVVAACYVVVFICSCACGAYPVSIKIIASQRHISY